MLARYAPLRRTPFRRKPPKTQTIRRSDGREILAGEAWEARREECFHREHGICEGCRRFAPLHDTVKTPHPWALPAIEKAGHAHHKRLRVRGLRDDRLENLRWLCWICHDEAHKPKKVVPRKVMEPCTAP